jgi:hypothetical protein
MGCSCSTQGEMRIAYNILTGKPEGKRQLGRTRFRWEDNIGLYLRGIGWEGVGWIHLTKDKDKWMALVNTVMNFRIP